MPKPKLKATTLNLQVAIRGGLGRWQGVGERRINLSYYASNVQIRDSNDAINWKAGAVAYSLRRARRKKWHTQQAQSRENTMSA
jgi:hypothetical protein